MTIDRDRQVVTRVRYRFHSQETNRSYLYENRYEEVGTADLNRPDAIGPRGPLEWVWDLAYY